MRQESAAGKGVQAMPATDAGVRRVATEGASVRQIQIVAAPSAESAEAALKTVQPTKAFPTIAKEASTAMHLIHGHRR
jgi:hypothetical protein